MRFTITSVAAFAATAAALSITSPEKHDDVDLSKSTTIEWNSVSSDPSSFDIYLVNMNGYPNVNKLVAENVKTSDNSYTLKDLAGIDNGSGFQVNFMSNDDKNTGILAQSAQFNVESSDSASTTSVSSSSTSTSSSSSSSSASSAASTTTKGKTTTAKSSTSSPTTTNTRKHTTTSCTRTSSHASSASPSTTLGTSTVANSSSSATPSETIVPANGAGSLKVPVAAAGSLLMGLYMML